MDAVRETYYETVATRSVQKNSARHKANGSAVAKLGSKPVTTTEILDRHGPVMTYPSTDSFMTYPDFVRLPNDLKVEFVNKMMDRYDISLKYLSRFLFNKGDDGLRAMCEKWKILKQVNTRKKRGDTKESIERFRNELFDWQERTKKAREMDRIQDKMKQKSCPTLVTYTEFKRLTPEQQADFINRTIKYHQVTATMIAVEVFEIRGTSLYNHFQRVGITKKIENLPVKISRNKEIMRENEAKFKRFVSAWKDFSEQDMTEEESKVEEEITPQRLRSLMAGAQKLPDDSEFEFAQHELPTNWYDVVKDNPCIEDVVSDFSMFESEKQIKHKVPDQIYPVLGIHNLLKTTFQKQEEPDQRQEEPDSMEYHQMHFSTSYISTGGVNIDEIYTIAAFFKKCKRVKVNIEISEV